MWSVIDLFAGEANISKLAAKLGFQTTSVDVRMKGADVQNPRKPKKNRKFPGPKRNLLDINGHCGFP